MAKVSLTSSINGAFLERLSKHLSSQEGSTPRSASSASSLSTILRSGAKQYGVAVRTLNSAATVIDTTDEKLAHLEKLTDKLIVLAERAYKAGSSSQSRRSQNSEYRKIAIEFQKLVKTAKVGDIDILTRPGLEELFTRVGLDPEKARGLGQLFDKFLIKGSKELLAAEDIKGKRPVYAPSRSTPPPIPEFENGGTATPGTPTTRQIGTGSFSPAVTYSLDSPSFSLTSADFNSDGYIDIAATSEAENSAVVYLGNGDGTLKAGATFAVGAGPQGIKTADVNEDGQADLITADNGSSTISILLSNGDGSFKAAITLMGDSGAFEVTTGDFNGDGNIDIAASDTGNQGVSVYLGNGDGGFKARTEYATGTTPFTVLTADFNGDGVLDLATGDNGTDSLSVLIGNGDGSFKERTTLVTDAGVYRIAARDVNGDGRVDLVNTQIDATVRVYLNNGNGSFKAGVSYSTSAFPNGVILTDLNGDGKIDIGTGDETDNVNSILFGNGDGTFKARISSPTGGTLPRYLYSVDLNEDGAPDLLNTFNGGGLSVTVGTPTSAPQPSGTFTSTTTLPTVIDPEWMGTGDFDGDGIPDLVASSDTDGKAGIYIGNGDGTFKQSSLFELGNGSSGVIADLDRDGKQDIIINDSYENKFVIFKGNGDGTFSKSEVTNGGQRSGDLRAGDFNNDGELDLYFTQDLFETVGAVTSVALGNGDGTFKAIITSYSGLSTGTGAVGDYNSDGIVDVAVSNTIEDTFTVLLGNGDGTFKAGASYNSNTDVNIAHGDFNGDSHLDMISSGHYSEDLVFHFGNGDGSFKAAVSYAAGTDVWSAPGVADLNGDGYLDVLDESPEQNAAFYLLGNGDGTFKAMQTFASTSARTSVIADFNQDGILDVIASGVGGGVRLALGGQAQSTPSNPGSNGLFVGQDPRHVVSRDLNGDGSLDFATADSTSETVSIVLGNGDGTFKARRSYRSIGAIQYLQFGDVTGDGTIDLVASHSDGKAAVLGGNGNGTFQAASTVHAGSSESLLLKDVNGDSKLDLLTLDKGTNELRVSVGNGDGSFKVGTTYSVFGSPTSLAVADLDGDGKQDVGTMGEGGIISILMGTGSGSFKAATSLQRTPTTAALSGDAISFVDVNGDTFLDLVNLDSGVSVAFGNGDGSFQEAKTYLAGLAPSGMTIKDSDGDGKVDIHVSNFGDNTAAVLKGNGDGSFQQPYLFSTGRGPSSINVGDFNGDGKGDILVTNATDNTVSFLANKSSGNTEGSNGRKRAKEITSLFASSTNISSREGAAIVLSDLKALKNQIKENRKIIKEVRGVVEQNIELARSTGMAMLDLSSAISDDVEADAVAAEIRKAVRRGAPGALSQLGNLEAVIVASLTLDDPAK